MLMHTKGVLVMTPDSAMVLTGKQAIEYSGGVAAEDNLGIGGYERIMGPNGEAQYWAPTLTAACELLHRHYELTYRAPGERWPRRAVTTDPADRDVALEPAPSSTGSTSAPSATSSRRGQPRPQEAVRHPHRDGRRRRRRPRAARTLARDGRGRDGGRAGRPARRLGGDADRHGVAAAAPPWASRRPTARAVVGGHAVPAVVEEGGPGDQRGERLPARGDARQPVRLRRLARVAPPPAAGVRRGDRAGDRELRRPVRARASCRATTAGRSSCSRRSSTTTWRCSPSRARSRR